MKTLFLGCQLFLSLSAWGLPQGTEATSELDYKLAYILPSSYPLGPLLQDLQKKLTRFTQGEHFTESHVNSPLYLAESLKSFVFRDIYFDTPQSTLLNKNAAYRLRYRWSSLERYLRFQLFPFLSEFGPNRLEIQLKKNYQFNPHALSSQSEESRFEFRNESPPFREKGDAPPPPWPLSLYTQVAQRGRFRHYEILPHREARELIADETLPLGPVADIVMIRYRTHLNLKTPWGQGPNPDHLFIITLDKLHLSDDWYLLELEIEFDRNIKTILEKILAKKIQVSAEAMAYGQDFMKAVHKDQQHLSSMLLGVLTHHLKTPPLPPLNKYQRIRRGRHETY